MLSILFSPQYIKQLYSLVFQRQEQAATEGTNATDSGGQHLSYIYKDRSILDDATGLVIHHMKRQTSEYLTQSCL